METNNFIKIGLIALALLAAGFLLLNIAGQLFIREVVQVVSLGEGANAEITGVAIGEEAPFWELGDLAGQKVALSHYQDKPLVVTFWSTWNQIAADQISVFDRYLARDTNTLFEIITINNQEGRGIVSNFMRRGGYQVRVLLDETGAVGELYKVKSLPVTYFIDKEGIVRDIVIGAMSEKMLEERIQAIVR